MKVYGQIFAVLALVLSPVAVNAGDWSNWMTSAQYQQDFNTRANAGFYPHKVDGKCQSGIEEFRAEWRKTPSGDRFLAHHGIDRGAYDSKNREYTSKGFSLVFVTTFTDCSGVDRYQATWLKLPAHRID